MGKSIDGSWGSSMRLDGQKIHRANHRMYKEIKFQFVELRKSELTELKERDTSCLNDKKLKR